MGPPPLWDPLEGPEGTICRMYHAPAPFFHTWRDNLSNVSCARSFFVLGRNVSHFFLRSVLTLALLSVTCAHSRTIRLLKQPGQARSSPNWGFDRPPRECSKRPFSICKSTSSGLSVGSPPLRDPLKSYRRRFYRYLRRSRHVLRSG